MQNWEFHLTNQCNRQSKPNPSSSPVQPQLILIVMRTRNRVVIVVSVTLVSIVTAWAFWPDDEFDDIKSVLRWSCRIFDSEIQIIDRELVFCCWSYMEQGVVKISKESIDLAIEGYPFTHNYYPGNRIDEWYAKGKGGGDYVCDFDREANTLKYSYYTG